MFLRLAASVHAGMWTDWWCDRCVPRQQEKLAEAEARVAELSQQLQQLQVEKVGCMLQTAPLCNKQRQLQLLHGHVVGVKAEKEFRAPGVEIVVLGSM